MKFKKSKSLPELVVTSDPKMTRMIEKLTEVIYEYKGWKFLKPSPKEASEIRRGVAEMKSGKVKTISSQDLIKNLKKL